MKKTLVALACLIAGTAIIHSAAAFAEEFCVPLGTVTLAAPEGVEARRGSVDFPHSQHFGLNCGQCHHTWTGDEAIEGCMTSGCHDSAVSLAKDNPAEAWSYYKEAFHKSCIGCHKQRAMKNAAAAKAQTLKVIQLKTGPTGCKGCHSGGA